MLVVTRSKYNQLKEDYDELKKELRGLKISTSKQKKRNQELEKSLSIAKSKLEKVGSSDKTKFVATFDRDGNVKFDTQINEDIIDFMIDNGYIKTEHSSDEQMHYIALVLMAYDVVDQYLDEYMSAVDEIEQGDV